MIRNIKLRLFLEGIEVPTYGATVNPTSDLMHGANISIIATPEALRIRPRTNVVLTFFDPAVGKDVVLFEGEVYALTATRGSTGNALTINAVDHSSYLSAFRPYYIDSRFSPPEEDSISFLPASTSVILEAFVSNSVFLNPSFKKIISLAFTKEGGLLDFFRLANDRLKLTDRIEGASGKFPISGFLLKAYIKEVIFRYGSMSIVPLLKASASVIMHKFISISSPSKLDKIKTWAIIPDLFYAPPPMCNVIFPTQIKSYNWTRAYLSQITRSKIRDSRLEAQIFPGVSSLFLQAKDQDIVIKPDDLDIKDPSTGKINTKRDFVDITDEELEKGPVPSEENLVPVPNIADNAYRKDLAEYTFRKIKIQNASMDIDILFNPYVVPGFPLIIVDNKGFAFHGILESAVHNIRKGLASTKLIVSHVRQLEFFDKFDPPFVDGEWTFSNVGVGFRTILSNSIQTVFERIGSEDPNDVIEFAKNVSSREQTLSEIFRPIFPLTELFSLLGSTPNDSGTEFAGTTFVSTQGTPDLAADILEPSDGKIPGRQDIVLKYKESLR